MFVRQQENWRGSEWEVEGGRDRPREKKKQKRERKRLKEALIVVAFVSVVGGVVSSSSLLCHGSWTQAPDSVNQSVTSDRRSNQAGRR